MRRRLAFVLVLGFAALAAGEVCGQSIRLTAEQTPLGSVLQQLASQTGIDLVYAQRLVEGRAVTGRYLGDDPEQALATILRGSGLRAEQLRPGQYVIVSTYPTPGLEPETYRGTLRGTVVDAETGEVLPGAHVLLVGLQLGTATNPAGYFALPNLPAGSYRIRVSYIGYQAVVQEVSAYPESEELPPTIRLRPQILSTDSEALVEGSENERTDLQPVPGTDALDVRQAAAVPAFLGESDVFQALEWLPGVGRSGEAGGELVVRGSEPHFNRYLLDGAPIIHPWHTFGLFSTFQTEALKSVRLYKGSFPAEYGGGLSAVLDVEMKDGDRDDAAGIVALSPVSLRAVSEVPLGNGVSLMLSGRRTYLDLLLSPQLQPGAAVFGSDEVGAQQGLGYHFFDLNAKVTLRPSPYHRLSLSVYEGGDALDTDVPFISRFASTTVPPDARLNYGWGNRVVSARYRWLASRRLFLTSTAYYSRYRADEQVLAQSTASVSVDSDYRVRFAESGVTVDADYYYSLEHQFRAGLRIIGRTFESRLGETVLDTLSMDMTGSEQNASVQAVEAVAYLQDTWQPSARWQVQPGLRVEVFGLGPYLSVSPRLNVRYAVTRDRLFLKAGVSRQVQYLHRLRDRYSFTYDLAASRWIPASASVRPAVGWQAAVGLEAAPTRWLSLGFDLYGRHHGDILLPIDEFGDETDEVPGALLSDYAAGSGRSFGIETSAQAERGRWRLGLSYAFARSQVRPPGEVYRRANYDAPHTAKALVQGRMQRWTVSLAATVRSGYPVTVPVTRYEDADPLDGEATAYLARPEINNGRLPVYARVDLAVGYGFRALGLDWDASLQAYNLLNRRNTVGQRFAPEASAVQTTEVLGLPILPMGSLKVRW